MIGGFSRGLGLVVMMWCKDGRDVVLKNASVIECAPISSIVTAYVVCDKR